METNGTRNHYRGCIRSRPVRGEARFKTREMLEFIPAAALRDKHYDQLTTAQRVLGSHVSVPSAQAYRKIKSESKPWKKSLRWEELIHIMKCAEEESGESFIRYVQMYPPAVIMFSDFQVIAFDCFSKNDIVYFDATGSILRRDPAFDNLQVYTLIVRNPTRGELSLPVATFLSNKHDAITIGHFLETFLRHRTQLTGSIKLPAKIMIDGSYAIWNASLRAFTSETRDEYYKRCFRIACGTPKKSDILQTFFHNCLSHAMKAGKL